MEYAGQHKGPEAQGETQGQLRRKWGIQESHGRWNQRWAGIREAISTS